MIKVGDILSGKISMNQSGSAYLVSPDLPKDIYLARPNTNTAFHLDEVQVEIIEAKDQTNGRKIEGKVVAIDKRFKTEFVGQMQVAKKHAFFVPDSTKHPDDFFIPLNKLNSATHGQKVVVELTGWKSGDKNPRGKVVRILGDSGDHETEIHSILEEYGLPYKFDEDIEIEAKTIPQEITKADINERKDMRDVLTFTIDPQDAKDFDDALSIEWVNGECFIGVHIADVSHYLKTDTELDKEAYTRGNSVYLVDRCIPMLPEVLSNNLCSLRPHEDKLCYSIVFNISRNGKIKEEWIGRTVIHSDHRFSYEQAQDIIEGKYEDIMESEPAIGKQLIASIKEMNQLAKTLRKERLSNKSITLDKQEVKFKLDEANEPIGIILKSSKDSNKLIEEFMLLANKQIARYVNKNNLPLVHRAHDRPNEAKLEQLRDFVKQLGYEIKTGNPEEISSSLNKLLTDVKGTAEANMIESLVVKTMQKAIYTTKNIGHYGLGFEDYTHFTSPIRRYSDVLTHRLLNLYLNGNKPPKIESLETKCLHLSEREKKAQKAERDSIKFMQCKYMIGSIGKVFDAVITSIAEFGIFVEIGESKTEAMIKLSAIEGTWTAEPQSYSIKEFNTGAQFRIGDEVKAVITAVDLEKRTINATLFKL